MRNRWLLVALGIAVLVGLFLWLRPDSTEPTSTTSPTPEPTVTATDETVEPTSTPSLDAIEIEVEDGQVDGPETITVAQGDHVAFEVTSDVADEVHVHGYNLMFDVEAGVKTLVELDATVPGIFEIELEGAGLPLTRLEVTA
jgi:heme/copper-type cytochrome/quinol oxidase subunit 2